MHPGEVKDTPKELRYYINMNIVPENNIFKKSKVVNVHAIILKMRKVSYLCDKLPIKHK